MGVASGIYEGGGSKPVSWQETGETIEGEIVAIRSKQLTKFGSEVLETWDDGSPKMTPIVTVQIEGGLDDDEDDGQRDIYLRSNAYTAFGKALREAFKAKPEDSDLIGARLKIQFYKTEKSGKGQPRKLFRARITPKAATAASSAWDAPDEQPVANGAKPASSPKPSPGKPPAMPPDPPDDDSIPF